MKILVAIDAPSFGKAGWGGRETQWQLTGIAKMVRLFASRIEFGQTEGTLHGDAGASLRWKIEQFAPVVEGDEAA